MLEKLKTFHFSPPKLTKRGLQARQKVNEKLSGPSETNDVNLNPTLADEAKESPKRWAITGAVVGSVVALGMTGLGMLNGAAQQAPQQTETVVEQVVEQQTPEVLMQMEATPGMVVAGRQQELLSSGKILKFDQFPGMRREHLPEQLEGAPNFRQVEGTNVYGVAQPTVQGIRNVLDHAGAKEREVVWTNMREEPVVYVNGRSFTIREEAHPFENSADFMGQSAEQIEAADAKLKAEVLREAEQNGGRMLIHTEASDGSLVPEWVEVNENSVQTPGEVYAQLKKEGYKVDFARLPVTDEQAPEIKDLDALVNRLKGSDEDTPLIFNCHAGRGRTTTAMVAAQLLQNAQAGESVAFAKQDSVRQDIREHGSYENGDYRLILSLIDNMTDGAESKAQTDQVLDRTEHIQNLRRDINKYRERSLNGASESKRESAESRGKDYLRRYHRLINFNQYLQEQAPKNFEQSYDQWLQQRPEIEQMLESFELAFNDAMGTPTVHPAFQQDAVLRA